MNRQKTPYRLTHHEQTAARCRVCDRLLHGTESRYRLLCAACDPKSRKGPNRRA